MPSTPQLDIQTRLIDAIHDLCIVLSQDFSILYGNRKAQEIFRQTEEELIGKDFAGFVNPEGRNLFRDNLKILRPNQSTDLSLRFAVPNREFEGEVRAHRTTIQEGEVYVITVRDMGQDQQKELDLLRFSSVIEHTINPIQITDANARMVYVNPAFERASGYRREELIGKNPNILSSGRHDKNFWKKVWETILSGESWVGELENRRKAEEETRLAAAKEKAERYNQHLRQAETLMSADNFELALQEYQTILDEFPGDAKASSGIDAARNLINTCNLVVGKWNVAPNGIKWDVYDDNTVFGAWLACANMAVDDCTMMLFRVNSAISAAMSASRMTDSAFVNSSTLIRSWRRLLSRVFFWKAPSSARFVVMSSIAFSISRSEDVAPSDVLRSTSRMLVYPDSLMTPRPSTRVLVLESDTATVCPANAPTWKIGEFW